MKIQMAGAGMVLLGLTAWADDVEVDRAKLAGKWELQAENSSGKNAAWVLTDKGLSIRLTQSQGQQTISDFECNLGEECQVKDSGKSAKVTLYFNGPKLVELETRGSEVVKRRFTVESKADTLEVELIPIVPGGKTETTTFRRVALSASK